MKNVTAIGYTGLLLASLSKFNFNLNESQHLTVFLLVCKSRNNYVKVNISVLEYKNSGQSCWF